MSDCAVVGCAETAVARVCLAYGADRRPIYAIQRPLREGDRRGYPACLHHAHHAVDELLMDAMEDA